MALEKFIKVFDNTIDPVVIGSCIKYFNTLDFEDAGIIHNPLPNTSPIQSPPPTDKNIVDKSIRNTQSWSFKTNKLTDIHWKNLWRDVLLKTFVRYQNETDIKTKINVTKLVTLNALKYEEGGFYRPHSDSHAFYPRTISIVYFLNNDYEGGELVFHSPDHECKEVLRIKPAPGRAVFWPSNFLYPHSISKVTKGRRYALVSWLA
jgi:hypothetical protein